jgi:hypothetical protein
LPRIANNQIQFMMYQLAALHGLEHRYTIDWHQPKKTEQYSNYEEVKAEPKLLGEDGATAQPENSEQ